MCWLNALSLLAFTFRAVLGEGAPVVELALARPPTAAHETLLEVLPPLRVGLFLGLRSDAKPRVSGEVFIVPSIYRLAAERRCRDRLQQVRAGQLVARDLPLELHLGPDVLGVLVVLLAVRRHFVPDNDLPALILLIAKDVIDVSKSSLVIEHRPYTHLVSR